MECKKKQSLFGDELCFLPHSMLPCFITDIIDQLLLLMPFDSFQKGNSVRRGWRFATNKDVQEKLPGGMETLPERFQHVLSNVSILNTRAGPPGVGGYFEGGELSYIFAFWHVPYNSTCYFTDRPKVGSDVESRLFTQIRI